jgi:hypothetical protein
MRAVNVNAGPLFSREDQQTAAHLVQRAFDVADAQAALIAADRRAELGTQKSSSNDKRDGLQAAIQRDEVEVERLARRLGQVPAAQRTDAARELAAASNQLELDRTRLSFLTDLAKLEAAAATPELDLAHQIQALRDSVPELRAPDAVDSPPVNTSTTTWALLQRLVALQRSRGSLADLDRATETIARTADTDLRGVRNVVRPIMARLQVLAKEPGAQGRSLPQDQQEFHDLLERLKVLGRVVLPLQQEAALARRFAGELDGRQTAINRESLHSLQDIGVQLIGVVVAMAIIFVVGLVWRIATLRYVSDPYRRRLLLNARRIVLIAAVTLVLVFHFTSELAALVTALGFAGITSKLWVPQFLIDLAPR